jgi:hypothetical protein
MKKTPVAFTARSPDGWDMVEIGEQAMQNPYGKRKQGTYNVSQHSAHFVADYLRTYNLHKKDIM